MPLTTRFSLPRLSVLALASCLLLTQSLSSCQKKEDAVAPTPAAPAVQLATDAKLGSYLTDGQGNTLYYFSMDVTGSNNCGAAACAAQWPVFYAPTITAGTGLNTSDFTTGKTAGGQSQTFYKGWPLYYYASTAASGQSVREQPGQTQGNGVGNVWYVVRPDYNLMMAMGTVMNKSTNKASLKPYLIDPQGRTLYTFSLDAAHPATQPTNCTGGCLDTWPIFYQANLTAPSGLKASDFGTITRTDGPNGSTRLQTTYKGNPLYYYAGDNSTRGKVEGESSTWTAAQP